MEVATSRAATLIVSLGNYVELFGLSSNPAPKIDLPLGDLEGRLDKEPAKNVKTASRENARQRGRLINMRYNLAFVCVSGIDSGLKIICLFSFLFVEWIFADFRLYYYKMRYDLASEPDCWGTRASSLSPPCIDSEIPRRNW